MKRGVSFEFGFQMVSLLASFVLIHGLYLSWIRPQASAFLEQQAELRAAGDPASEEQSWAVILKDMEQETCLILSLWAVCLIFFKIRAANSQRKMVDSELVQVPEGMRVLPEDTREFARKLEALPERERDSLLPRALRATLHRFASTRNVQDAAAASREVCKTEGDRLDAELSMIRYIAWAIPSIGFIGTVRGIGTALARADSAMKGDISPVTLSLGTAFNSTLIALMISIVLMFIIHQLQLVQERLVIDAESYCDQHLIRHLHSQA